MNADSRKNASGISLGVGESAFANNRNDINNNQQFAVMKHFNIWIFFWRGGGHIAYVH